MSIATAELRAELRKEISEWKARALEYEQALRYATAALITLRDTVQKSKALEGRQYVQLGIEVNRAIDIARAALDKPEGK